MKLLVVEDSKKLREFISVGMTRSGYSVDAVTNGKLALQHIAAYEYSVIILDLVIPEINGLEVLKLLRKRGCNAGVLILSARSQIADRITGLELGADDYLVKPFCFDELVARVGALNRRYIGIQSPPIMLGRVEINTTRRSLICAGNDIQLTRTEYRILEYLAMRRGRVVSASDIEQYMCNSGTTLSRSSVEVHISSIRRKILMYSDQVVISTRRGFGYLVDF